MRLETVLSILVLCGALLAVQLVILTVEIAALKRAINTLMRMVHSLNEAVNPWAAENEPTDPHMPPRAPRKKRRLSFFVPFTRKRE